MNEQQDNEAFEQACKDLHEALQLFALWALDRAIEEMEEG